MGTTYDAYHQLMADFPDAIVVHDGLTILYANHEAVRISGLASRPELEGRSVLSFVPKDFVGRVRQRISQVTQEQRSTELLRERLRLPDGRELHVEIKTMPIEFDGKKAIQLVARDCTERVKSEAALVESEQRFRTLLNDMHVGVVVHDARVEISHANPAALELLGLTEDQLLGRSSFDPMWNVIREDGSPFPGTQHPAPVALATGLPVFNTTMGVYHPKAHAHRWLSVDAVPRYDEGRHELQAVVTFVDVTERQKAQEAARALLDEKEALLREVHHRIKNNMATVKGLLFLQAESLAGTPSEKALRDAESRIAAMMVLYDKLYRSGAHGYLSADEYLPTLVQEVTAGFPGGDRYSLQVETDRLVLSAEQLQSLGIIVNELLTNILKYAFRGRDTGQVTLQLKNGGKHARLTVVDDGVGFPQGVDFDRSPGFGLSLVAMLARSLHGQLSLRRTPGTTIELEFPYDAENSSSLA